MANRRVLVRIEHELLLTGNRQEREHVAARECGYESLLGIDIRRIAEISRGRRRHHHMAAVEAPSMITRILLIRKLSSAALPFQGHFVFGHAVLWRVRKRTATVPSSPSDSRGPAVPAFRDFRQFRAVSAFH